MPTASSMASRRTTSQKRASKSPQSTLILLLLLSSSKQLIHSKRLQYPRQQSPISPTRKVTYRHTPIPRIRFHGPIRMPNTLRPILILNNIQLLLSSRRSIRMLKPSLRSSLGRGTRRSSLCGGIPLRGAGGELHEVVFFGHAIPLCDPAFGERWWAVGGAFLAGSVIRFCQLGAFLFGVEMEIVGDERTLMDRSWLCCAGLDSCDWDCEKGGGERKRGDYYEGGRVLCVGWAAKIAADVYRERGCAAPREFTSATPYCICLSRAFSCAGVTLCHHYGYYM